MRFSLNSLLDTSLKYFMGFFAAVNEVNSKHSQISRSLIYLQGKILIFKELQLPLTFQVQALFKDFKILHESCYHREGRIERCRI